MRLLEGYAGLEKGMSKNEPGRAEGDRDAQKRVCGRCSKEIVFSRLSFQEDIFGEANLTCIVFCTNRTDVKIRFSKFS